MLAMANQAADYEVLNVGTGRPISVLRVGELLARELGWSGGFDVVRRFRAGDIRHCFADTTRIRSLLGYEPKYRFEDGVQELVTWVSQQDGLSSAGFGDPERHLADYGLVR